MNRKSEFVTIQTNLDADGVVDRSFKVTQINGDVVMTEGRLIEDGVLERMQTSTTWYTKTAKQFHVQQNQIV